MTPARLLVALTVVTGIVDAVSFLGLGHVFVANMTGNVVFLGFAVSGAEGLSALASLTAILGFLAGALLGGRLAHHLGADPTRLIAVATAAQTLLVAASAALTATDSATLLIVVLSVAMGLQNAAVRKIGLPDLTTTVLTMTLTGFAADSKAAGGPGAHPLRKLTAVVAMFGGAAVGALLYKGFGLLVPILAALAVLVTVTVLACFAASRARR